MENPQNKELRIYFNSTGAVRYYSVKDIEEAVYLFKKLAQGDLTNSDIAFNIIDLEIYNSEDSEWETYYNEDGWDFKEVLEEMDTALTRTVPYTIDDLNKQLAKVSDQQ